MKQPIPNNLLLERDGLKRISLKINNKIITNIQRIIARKSSITYYLNPILGRSFFCSVFSEFIFALTVSYFCNS